MSPVRLALVVALGLRLAFAVGYWRDQPLTHDEQEYLVLATNLAAGRGFERHLPGVLEGPRVQRFARAPLYPALIAGLMVVSGTNSGSMPSSVPLPLKVFQCVAALVGIWFMTRIAARAAGPPAAVVAAWLAACYPPLVWMCAYALSEGLYSTLVLGCVWALGAVMDEGRLPVDDRRARRVVAASGVVAGIAALVRSSSLVFVPLAAAWLIARRRFALAAILLVGAALSVAPWTLRNFLVHGRPIVVAADGGVTFWTGNHPEARGEGDLAANPHLRLRQQAFLEQHPGLSPEELEPLYYRDALAWITREPLRWSWLLGRKFIHVWLPTGPSYRLHSARYYWATVVPYLLLLPWAIAGGYRLWRDDRLPTALLLLAASQVLICLIFFPQERFRLPVLDPTYVVLGAAGIAGFRSSRRVVAPAA